MPRWFEAAISGGLADLLRVAVLRGLRVSILSGTGRMVFWISLLESDAPPSIRHLLIMRELTSLALDKAFLIACLVGLVVFCSEASGQNYDPPSNYYSSATGTGATLESQLHNIIDNHTVFSYNGTREVFRVIDADPNNSNNILLTYNQQSVPYSPTSRWNREHTWPRSRGVDSSGPDNSDVHHLRPSDIGINSDRGNLHFGGAFGSGGGSYGTRNDGNGTVWYPGDWDAGHIARQQFYMQVRYDGSDGATNDLELANGTPGGNRLGDLNRLMEWHYAAPVDEFERRRNDLIYDDFQGNRNPFIDLPEVAWSVFVDQQNDSRIELAGGVSDGQGGTSLDVSVARVIAGTSAPKTAQVTLNKSGLDGTYYSVTTDGPVTSSIEGRLNAFRSSQTDSETITVGVIGSTLLPGTTTGSVKIDNLDITTAGGVGRGDNDADDVINVSLTAVSHAEPSFFSFFPQPSRSIDLGDFFAGSQFTPSTSVDIFNLASAFGAELTAALDLDAIVETDVANRFSFDGSLFSNLAATESASIEFQGLSDQLGQFSATYEFQVSDEDIPGAESSTLTLDLTFDVVAEVGDFSISGTIDDEDIDFYSGQLGTQVDADSPLRELDLDGDGTITLDDHELHITTLVTTDLGKGALIGDTNLDGTVDVLEDAATLIFYLGQSGVGYKEGDLNADGTVDVLGDAALLIVNLGQSSATSSATVAAQAVPEPSGLLGLSLLLGLASCRRERGQVYLPTGCLWSESGD